MRHLKKIHNIAIITSLLITLAFLFSLNSENTTAVTTFISPGVLQKGICFATWDKQRFSSSQSDKAINSLKDMGVEYIQIVVTLYQDTYNSTTIKKTDRTPLDSSIKHAIKKSHEAGLKVMLKPHIDLIDSDGGNYWRADIGFYNDSEWNKWFDIYGKAIKFYAKMAEKLNVEIFCVGTELSFASQKTGRWETLIKEVRERYSGKLLYAANWDNYKNINFWDKLDYIGIDAYFPLTHKSNPDVEDLKKGWSKWTGEIESWVNTVKKPIIFTEIGYASTPMAPSKPWENGYSGNADTSIQSKCYKAFFETVWRRSWLKGVYWWRWAPSTYGGGKYDRKFTPKDKPAADILSSYYKSKFQEVSDLAMDKSDLAVSKSAIAEKKAVSVEKKKLMEAISEKVSGYFSELKPGSLVDTQTLSPGIRTSNDTGFKKAWDKQTEEKSRR